MSMVYEAFAPGVVVQRDGELLRRRAVNRDYMMRLSSKNLLLNFTHEAGMRGMFNNWDEPIHGGWESPLCQLRGHFLGHWLSAAAMNYKSTGDIELKAKADAIVDVLNRCQQANGGEWVGSIPEKYLDWIAQGRGVWAPHYTLHKTLMGLLDMYELAGNEQALTVAKNFAKWFSRWTAQFTREQFDDILDVETGGMLEVWAQLYGITGESEHRELMNRYYRSRLFDPLLAGDDVLTNMHANTTVPEILGAAKAYEVTGERKWLDIVRAYWEMAVTERGTYATGGQTLGEVWTPKHELSARLGDKNQEHCVVYNMMRVADFLFKYTGEAKFADYWERNLLNGVMAQTYWDGSARFTHGNDTEHPTKGLLTYFLPMRGGAQKHWASETEDFFCCHGTLVQANASFDQGIFYQNGDEIAVCQFFASDLKTAVEGREVLIRQRIDLRTGNDYITSDSAGKQAINEITRKYPHDPNALVDHMLITAAEPVEFTLKIRVPAWLKGEPKVTVNGEALSVKADEKGFIQIRRLWKDDDVIVEYQKGITAEAMPDDPNMVAFLNGPVVLAGILDEERVLYVDEGECLDDLLTPDNEREWANWKQTFRVKGQDHGIRFWPLHEVGYERYSIYFPVRVRK